MSVARSSGSTARPHAELSASGPGTAFRRKLCMGMALVRSGASSMMTMRAILVWCWMEAIFSYCLGVETPFFSHLIRWNNTARIKRFFSENITTSMQDYDTLLELKDNLPEKFNKWDALSKAQYLEMKIFMSDYLLSSQGDRVAMAHSLEIRMPYLDYRLIEFMGKVPSYLKIRGLNEKFILKKIYKDILPQSILNRPKHPYRAPIKNSLLNKDLEYVDYYLS